MKNANEMLQKLNSLLGQEKELIILKGKMFSPVAANTKEKNEKYYAFKLKVLKALSNDEYGQSFNTYFCIMPVEISKRFSDKEIQDLKNNEVLVVCSTSAAVKNLGQNGVVVNNITLYVNDIMQTRSIENGLMLHKAINL